MKEYILQNLPGDAHYEWVKSVMNTDASDSRFDDYSLDEDGLLKYQNRIYVPDREGLRRVVLEEMHNTPFSGHPGVNKMMADLRPLYFWLGLKRDVIEYVAQCLECQCVKVEHAYPVGLLYP